MAVKRTGVLEQMLWLNVNREMLVRIRSMKYAESTFSIPKYLLIVSLVKREYILTITPIPCVVGVGLFGVGTYTTLKNLTL
jgi:hypothetical protein